MTLRRGFKAEAERYAVDIREQLGYSPADPIDLLKVAAHLNVRVVSADALVERRRLEELERLQSFAFSACTFEIEEDSIVVTNPLHSQGRQTSDLAHELAHLVLKHDLSEIHEIGGVPFRTCRADQEEEATTFGGTLLLPRPLLLAAVGRGMSIDTIAEAYGVTTSMARFRVNTTGVGRQTAARRGFARPTG